MSWLPVPLPLPLEMVASQQGQLQSLSLSPLYVVHEAPEIPTSCLEQTAVRCKQCYLEYKAVPFGYSETRMERCCLRSCLYSGITSSFFMSTRKKSVYVS